MEVLDCASTVHKRAVFNRFELASSEKQIPQNVENTRNYGKRKS
jgi:hypothetical protein